MSFRTALILLNVLLLVGAVVFISIRYFRLRNNPEPHDPQNLEVFFDDAVLEGPHLERALGVALVALTVSVLALVAYFVWEPFRGADAADNFKEQSIQRGEVLFANADSPHYDATKSLLCANCHGLDGGGGSAPFVVKSEDPRCDPNQTVDDTLAATKPYCLPQSVAWAAPNLQLAGLRYSRAALTQVITYGRPGTPMPAWGVVSGKGVLNAQGIGDLVNYVESIVTTGDKARALADKALDDAKKQLQTPQVQAAAQKWADDSRAALAAARASQAALPATASADDKVKAQQTVDYMQARLDVALQWQQTTRSAGDGQILFMNNCARCHTRGWSYFDPTDPEGNPSPGLMGGGAFGPNLTGGDVDGQFPPPDGDDKLFAWVAEGVEAYQGYGIRGISSGRMPHFGAILTEAQIRTIMAYERSL